MAGLNLTAPAIVVLGPGSLATARRVQTCYPQASIHGLQGRVDGVEQLFESFGEHLRALYRQGTPILALCAAGIVIRSLASVLGEKEAEPPVLALAEDGSAVVPLLGGLSGVNRMARELAAHLQVQAAITTSGELRFGTCLLNPPAGYVLADLEQGKRFVSDLLAGEQLRIEGQAPWLDAAQLPCSEQGQRTLHVGWQARPASRDELSIHSRCVLVAVGADTADLVEQVRNALHMAGVAEPALACLLAADAQMADPALHAAADALQVPLRFAAGADGLEQWLASALPEAACRQIGSLQVAVAPAPLAVERIGMRRGRLSVVGLGPGAAQLMVPAAKQALAAAQDVLGYETYVRMAGPFRDDQRLHCTDNREELQRAGHAFELAAQGRSVVVVSSGDPGVFAMAAAVLEALHASSEPSWHQVELEILPGVSASLATAAWAGAPLGHDFCVMSLSDNLKPWSIIETRLDLAAQADLVLAFYNPISKSRPHQLGRALEVVRRHRASETPVVLGRDVGRPGATLKVVSLGELTPDMVDMRTMVLVGSSTTCTFPRADGSQWVYTPRWYPTPP
ncbi:precorrin-3B C(17)-methyltransferase [Pseudomonas sp. UBA6562]|uniref:precorrin-3B C(17)-methyltransferase n=1 Tax=Pseudomonas sp. UBA6562 TaxID=1947332 RepID=UPI0025D00C9E|nr:precorrin-3B C(17)-methyltransferase [Pseudomonas sp. UBA6562]